MKETTVDVAVAALWAVAKKQRIAGETPRTHRDLNIGAVPDPSAGAGFTLAWERAWGASATLSVRSTVKDGNVVLFVEVTWPSVGQGPLGALGAVALYSEVCNLAAWMQTLCDNLPPLKP